MRLSAVSLAACAVVWAVCGSGVLAAPQPLSAEVRPGGTVHSSPLSAAALGASATTASAAAAAAADVEAQRSAGVGTSGPGFNPDRMQYWAPVSCRRVCPAARFTPH